eukprot:527675-Rhodomonas_salina.1
MQALGDDRRVRDDVHADWARQVAARTPHVSDSSGYHQSLAYPEQQCQTLPADELLRNPHRGIGHCLSHLRTPPPCQRVLWV